MDSLILRKSGEDISTAIKTFLEANLDETILAVNTDYNDGISITSPEYIDIADPELVLYSADQRFPAMSIFCDDESEDDKINTYSIRVTSFIREDNRFIIEKLNKRFAKAVKATLKRDQYLSGVVNGMYEDISTEYGFTFMDVKNNALCISSEIQIKYIA